MESKTMVAKRITFFGQSCLLVCDGNCKKAWGLHQRPKEQLSDDAEDFVWLADDELPDAPEDPGTYEGECAKPTEYDDPGRQKKWCARECERWTLIRELTRDHSRRIKNYNNREKVKPEAK